MTYKDLDVFKRSYELAIKVHELSLGLPKEYKFELADQIRRVSRSIPSNIAEGFARKKSKEDTINQLKDALGSCDEISFNIEFMMKVKLIPVERYKFFSEQYVIVGKELTNLIKSLSKSTRFTRN
jgi:four helix bundle protein